MPITKDNNGKIVYTPKSTRFDSGVDTGVEAADAFAVCDNTDQLKQVQWDLAAMAAASRVKLKFQNPDPDQEIVLTFPSVTANIGGGGVGESFTVIQTDAGTYPTATGPTDALSLTSSSSALTITGNSATDTVTFGLSPQGPVTSLVYKTGGGDIESLGSLGVNSLDGVSAQWTIDVDNSGGAVAINTQGLNTNPVSASPNDSITLNQINANIDTDLAGFAFGTSGEALRLLNNSITHAGKSNVGGLSHITNNFNIGNGTDPITVSGLSYIYGFGSVAANVTVTGAIQGYGFQPNINSAATITGGYINAFYDFTQVAATINSYASFAASPTISDVATGGNYTVLNAAATVSNFLGNSGYIGVNISPNITSLDTGAFSGVYVFPTISGTNGFCAGINVSMDNVTSTGSVYAAFLDGDVQITGALTFGGALSIGQLNAFYNQTIVTGTGTPQSIHSLVSSMTLGASQTVTLADYIGVNTAGLITIGNNSSVSSSFLGLCALALPAVVNMGTGATLDRASGATFAVSLDAAAGGGLIDKLDLCRAVAIPNGVTGITELVGFKMDLPFGDPGTTTWGVYVSPVAENYLAGSLLIGGTAYTVDTVTNSSVGLELNSTTKAILLSRMTTTERNLLTGVNGMVLYNTTDNKVQAYANGAWVDLH